MIKNSIGRLARHTFFGFIKEERPSRGLADLLKAQLFLNRILPVLVGGSVLAWAWQAEAQHLFDIGKQQVQETQRVALQQRGGVQPQAAAVPLPAAISMEGVDPRTAFVVVMNEETGKSVVLSDFSSTCSEFNLTPLMVEEMKAAALGDAPSYSCVVMDNALGGGGVIKRQKVVVSPSPSVLLPVFNYGPKENVKTTAIGERKLVRVGRMKPRYTPSDPNDPVILKELAQLADAKTYYVYTYELPDGSQITINEPQAVQAEEILPLSGEALPFEFSVTGGTQQHRDVLTHVGGLWGDQLAGTVPVAVSVTFTYSTENWIASCGFTSVNVVGGDNFYSPAPLWNQKKGYDGVPGTAEISLQINTKFDSSFYFGTDGNAGAKIDLVTIILHELTHGLGMVDSIDATTGAFLYTTPFVFDTFLYYSGSRLTDQTDANRKTAITSNALYYDGPNGTTANGGTRIRLYAPTSYNDGSSVSHWDDSVSFSTFMKYQYHAPLHSFNTRKLGLMKDMGWTLASEAALEISPTARSIVSGGVSWSSLSVTANTSWSATADQTWITFPNVAYGSGNGTLYYSAAANTATSSRTATITVTMGALTRSCVITQAGSVTVTFNPQGGTVSPTTKAFSIGSTYGTLPTPTLAGNTFGGWWTLAGGTGTQITSSSTVNASYTTLYAKWTAAIATVTFNGQGGTAPVPAFKTVTNGLAYGTLATTTRAGFTFGGWWTAANGGGAEVTAATTVTITSAQTLYAKWAEPPNITLEAALDATNFVWTTGGSSAWFGQSVTTYDGIDAAQSGVITDSQTNWLQITITAPGILRYRWKVSSETGNDTLIFSYNGYAQSAISGTNAGWAQQGWLIPSGTSVLRWSYVKNGSVSSGSDCGWMDQVTWELAPTVAFDAQGGAVSPTSMVVYVGEVYGTLPTPTRSGYVFGGWWTGVGGTGTQITSASTVSAAYTTLYAKWTISVSLSVALDTANLTWTTGGSSAWFGQPATTHDGVDAAQSGVITDSQTNWLQTTVTGPGTLSYWWKVGCEKDAVNTNYDYLAFQIDGIEQSRIDGQTEWLFVTKTIASGSHTLKWKYQKDSFVSDAPDCGWVDQVVWVSEVTAKGTPYQWLDQFGLVSGSDYEAADVQDVDRDGLTAWQEYVAGTAPTNPASKFLATFLFTNGQARLYWTPDLTGAVPARVYSVYGVGNLLDAFPTTPVTNVQAGGSVPLHSFGPMRFFKVGVSLQH